MSETTETTWNPQSMSNLNHMDSINDSRKEHAWLYFASPHEKSVRSWIVDQKPCDSDWTSRWLTPAHPQVCWRGERIFSFVLNPTLHPHHQNPSIFRLDWHRALRKSLNTYPCPPTNLGAMTWTQCQTWVQSLKKTHHMMSIRLWYGISQDSKSIWTSEIS